MKHIDVITLFPEIVEFLLSKGVIFQGQKNKIFEVHFHNPRNFAEDKHRSVDDRPFGGGEGMVMMCEPLEKTYESIPTSGKKRFIYLSPQGQKLTAEKAQELSQYDQLVFLCGRYEGVDERFLSRHVDEEISIGDYVLSGGEIPCAVTIDAVARFYEGLLGNKKSAEADTFEGSLLKYPQYTRPQEYAGLKVPDVLTGGNHKAIEEYRAKVSVLRTYFRRSDLSSEWLKGDLKGQKALDDALKFYKTLTHEERKTLGLPKDLT
jgi:tRNA (guanine37-N1)-methyltransferase